MNTVPLRMEGYQLLHQGAVELARVESNGIRIDTRLLQETKDRLDSKISSLRQHLESTDIWQEWKKKFRARASLTSGDQLASLLFEEMGYTPTDYTETGKPSTDEQALQKIDHPEIPNLIRFGKFSKARGTFLKGIERELVGDRIHPFFNLHTVRSFRSSSDSPNFQNFPVRDKEISEIIRKLFIASEGCVLGENDFKGIEVALSASYHKDPNFIRYITTPGKDMHRDTAAQLYLLRPEEVVKDIRYGAKNKFVFPQFYGDFYVSCARSLWEWIRQGKLKSPQGDSLYEHLARQGIRKLGACDPKAPPKEGTFEKLVKEVEDDFWNRRFRVYGQWRKDWYSAYLKKGYFDLLTGFRIEGVLGRNAVTNYPVQGSAFHCLLWSLIEINRLLRRYKMKTRIVGQIHDSLISDIVESELVDYWTIVEDVTTRGLPRHYPWLVVPPEIEYELAPPGVSWHGKKEVKFKDGHFLHPTQPGKTTTDSQKLFHLLLN